MTINKGGLFLFFFSLKQNVRTPKCCALGENSFNRTTQLIPHYGSFAKCSGSTCSEVVSMFQGVLGIWNCTKATWNWDW